MKPHAYVLSVLALAAIGWVIIAGIPGCNPPPESHRRAVAHGDSARIAEQVANLYVPQIEAERARADSLGARADRAEAVVAALTSVATEANAEADRLLNEYLASAQEGGGNTRTLSTNASVLPSVQPCSLALDACTTARTAQARVIEAQRVEIAALSDQVRALSRLDSLRAGETAALREAYEQMESAYLSMEQAYEAERAARLSMKRRRLVERVAWVGVVAFAVTR